jgi:PAS domain S-box-containing protein
MGQQVNNSREADIAPGQHSISGESYRLLFNHIDEGYYLCDVIFDEHGNAVDVYYVDANPAAIRMSGEDRRGRTLREVGNYEAYWYELFGRVARTGISERLEQFASPSGLWVDVYTFKIGESGNRIAMVFRDITERKRREADLVFLADLADEMSRLSSVDEIMKMVGVKIGMYLKVKSCLFVDVDDARGEVTVFNAWTSADVPGLRRQTIRLSDFISDGFSHANRAGEVVVIHDTCSDPRSQGKDYSSIGVGAFLTVPFHRNGVWTNYLAVTDSEAHDWRDDDIALFRELSNRVFPRLDRARTEEALQKAHERLQQAMDAGNIFSWEMDPETRRLDWSDNMEAVIGFPLRDNIDKTIQLIHPDDIDSTLDAINLTLKTGVSYASEYRLINPANGEAFWFSSVGALHKDGTDGKPRFVGVTQNITERRRAEEALRWSEEKFRTLFNSIDEGFYLAEIIRDETGKPIDILYLDENPAAMAMIGASLTGRRMSQLSPDYEQYWRDTFAYTARTGQGQRLEGYAMPNKMWFDYYVFKPEGITDERTFALLFKDVTERKRIEEAVRRAAELDAFRVRFNDAIRPLTDLVQIQTTACRLLCEHLDVQRVNYADIEDDEYIIRCSYTRGVTQITGRGLIATYPHVLLEEYRRHGAIAINDVATDLRFNEQERASYARADIAAAASVMLVKDDRWVASFAVHSSTPRQWAADELALVRETSERIWASVEGARAEEALYASEEKYRSLAAELQAVLQSMSDAVYIGEAGHITLANQPALDQLGYTSLAALNQDIGTLAEELHMRDAETGAIMLRDDQPFMRALGGEKVVMEVRMLDRLSSEERVLRCAASPIVIDGAIVAAVVVNTDITERKAAEEYLRFANARYRMAEEAAKGFVYDWNLSTGMVIRSETLLLLTGYTPQELPPYKEAWLALIHPEERNKIKQLFEAQFGPSAEDVHLQCEYRVLHKDGSYRYVNDRAMISHDITGKAVHVIGQIMDITERHEAEETLRISEERYRVALQSAEMGAWDWDVKADKVVWNEQHFILLGMEPVDEPQTAASFLQFVHPDHLSDVSNALKRAVAHNMFHAVFRIIRKDDGKTRWMSGFGRVITHEGNKATRMVGVMYDITEQKLLEQQKDAFIGIASHELKTPVTSMKVYAEIIQERMEEMGNVQDAAFLKRLNVQIDRLTTLINDLLDTTKISDGQLKFTFIHFDLNELVTEKVEELKRTTNHQFELQTEELPIVTADRERIGQVMTNFLSNAIKYSPQGTVIRILTQCDENNIKVSVQDEGYGISEEDQKSVFDRFFRVMANNMDTFPGMGLGLYISDQIIRRHGGMIKVESKLDIGSVFSFTLPLMNDLNENNNADRR